MNDPLFLGIDTSNYKTSVAVAGCDRSVLFEKSVYLHVDKGKRGLRQSEAFFIHSNRLPDFIKAVFDETDPSQIAAVGVSSRPRRIEGSYMPCFLAGVNAAKEIGAALRVPVYEFSHQEGHAAAIIESGADRACFSENAVSNCRTLLFHLSGGTTEFLLCRPDDRGYCLEIAGGTKDISIGQLLDRTGVAMGYAFPAGMYLDELASSFDAADRNLPGIVKPVRITDGFFNLSGSEAQIMRALEEYSTDPAERGGSGDADPYYQALSREIFDMISALLAASACELAAKYDIGRVYMAGGVASSGFIRNRIAEYISDPKFLKKHAGKNAKNAKYTVNRSGGIPEIIFGEPALCGDNAAGTAFLAAGQFMKTCGISE